MNTRKITWWTATVVAVAFGLTALVAPATSMRSAVAIGTTPSVQTVSTVGVAQPSGADTLRTIGKVMAGEATDKNAPSSAEKNWKREAAKKIIAFVKKHSKSAYEKLKAAAKKGYNAVLNWYKNLPWWLRSPISVLAAGAIEEVIKYIIEILR